MTKKDYDESSFRVLKGLEPVRERPGMYTRTDSPTHIIQEVIDNSADETLAGFAKKIAVSLLADGSIEIEDNGRSIPVGLHPEEKEPVAA
jgi:topoisomerase-4 subunit B